MKKNSSCPFDTSAQEMSDICARTFQKPQSDGSFQRIFHAPLIANIEGELEIFADIPENWRQGLFAESASYKITARVSNSLFANEWNVDSQGMAIRIWNVKGDVCEEAPANQHVLVLFSQKCFIAKDADEMLQFLKKLDGLRQLTPASAMPFSYLFPSVNPFKARWHTMKAISETIYNNIRHRSIEESSFNSVSPYKIGEGAMKYHIRPRGVTLGQGKTRRERLHSHLLQAPLEYDFLIQPKILETDPLEDLSQAWESPMHLVGKLVFPKHDILNTEIFRTGEQLSYNPWHCLKAHEPLGSINAARRVAYGNSGKRRGAV